MLRLRNLALFVLLLIPTFLMAWHNRTMPHFGFEHDDSIYYVVAKSVAEGKGLMIPSLPSQPVGTKFPPGEPFYQALAWIIEPEFPKNLQVALWLQWIWLPLTIWLMRRCALAWGFDDWTSWAITAAIGLNTFVFWGSISVMTELQFVSCLLASMLLAKKAQDNPDREIGWAVLAGAAAAGAYLFRTIGMFLLAGFPLVMLYRRRFSAAFSFAAPMLFAMIGWSLYTGAHKAVGLPGEIYYTSYLGYHISGFRFEDIPALIWGNLDGVTLSMGSILLPAQSAFPFLAILVRAVGIMSVIGIVRLVRRGIGIEYSLFCLVYFLMLMVWHRPYQRIIVPMLPLMLAGLAAEFQHLGKAILKNIKHQKRDQRIAAWGLAAASLSLIFWMASSHWTLMHEDMQGLIDSEAKHRQGELKAYQWVKDNLPADAAVLTGEDPTFYLYTGRRAVRTNVPLRHWYVQGTEEEVYKIYAEIDQFAQQNKLNYVYFGLRHPLLHNFMLERVTKDVHSNRGLEELYRHPGGTVYRVKPSATAQRAAATH